MYYTENGVLAAVRKTSGSGVSEDPMRDYSTNGCFVEGSQMLRLWNLYMYAWVFTALYSLYLSFELQNHKICKGEKKDRPTNHPFLFQTLEYKQTIIIIFLVLSYLYFVQNVSKIR